MTTSFLSTRRGQLTLLFLCGVAFLDFVDASIVNVALPSIRSSLHFSVQNLQWVLSAYLLTYGGFLLLGGRMADLLGRRRVLVTGIGRLRLVLVARRARPQLRPARRRPAGPGRRRGLDAARSLVDPHHDLP